MQHYSAVNYWTPGWVYPRSRLREPFPFRLRRMAAPLIAAAAPVHGPLIFPAACIYRPGMQLGAAYRPGAKQGEIYRPGMMAGEVSG